MMEPSAAQQQHASSTATPSSPSSGLASKLPPVPQVFRQKADDLAERIAQTDIARINGYMRLANLIGSVVLCVMAVVALFKIHSYSDFVVISYMLLLAAGLGFIENHERFPSIAEKIKINFGFMFTAFGKASYILTIAMLSFAFGWFGQIVGAIFLVLALFNFFLIYRHPAYQAHMTRTEVNTIADDEEMPELRYNNAQGAGAAGNKNAHVVV